MQIPTPPFPILSANGEFIAVPNQQELTLIEVASGTATTRQLPFHISSVAFSPSAKQAVASGSKQILAFAPQSAFTLGSVAAIPAPLFRMTLADDGVLVGAAKFSDAKTNLCVWHGPQLTPAFSGEGYPLGSVAPYHLRLDSQSKRVLVAGASGRSAYSGGAKLFAGLVNLSPEHIAVVWKGDNLPFQPHGFLYPLADDTLGIYQRNQLVIVALKVEGNSTAVAEVAHYAFTDLETVVASPDGNYVAWLWGSHPNAASHIRVGKLSDGTIVDEATIEALDYFPSIAVNNAGRVTLTYSQKPNQVLASTLENGQFSQRAVVAIPNYEEDEA